MNNKTDDIKITNQIKQCIEQIKIRPGMYIGGIKITYLRNFLDGVRFSLRQNKIPENQYLPELPFFLFHDYTAYYYGCGSSCMGYANIILENCNFDEEKALEKFFVIYNSFCEIKAEKIWTTNVDGKCCYKVKLSHNMGYILAIMENEHCIIKRDIIIFKGYFVQNETDIDTWVNKTYGKTLYWLENESKYIYSKNGFDIF